ncbi:MAG TPA: protein kinase [Gemmataceae bacterium]|jgi:serine/threonine-protein kinase|nr:protein kinase [Gemmataceae bacterium]
MIGTRLGSWVIEKELGQGGMGNVYLARREPPGGQAPDHAAIKILAPELAKEAGFLQRFEREIEALRQLSHPHIVRFYEAGAQDGVYYYAMEYVDGRNFEELIEEHGRLPWKEVLDAALQVTPALKQAHDHGIIHRDLKPHNLMRTRDGTVKLTDFGIARVFAAKQLTATGGLVGTAEYLSPEQAAGKPVTPRSDLYSLGVVLYVLLTGRHPFEGTSMVDLLHKHRYAQFDRPRRVVPEVPRELDDIVCQLLEKDPASRPANAMLLYRQLDSARRKLERKEQQTLITPGDQRPEADDPAMAGTDEHAPGPGTLMSRLMRHELEGEKRGGPVAQFFNRPLVLVTLLAGCVGLIVWGLWRRPAPSADELFERGSQLMKSTDPADWDKAWNEYLEPLTRKYPDQPYHDEIERYRLQKEDGDALLRALEGVNSGRNRSEAQRFCERGLSLCRQGDPEEARRVWSHVVDAFHGDESEQRWVRLAEQGLGLLEDRLPSTEQRRDFIRKAARRAEELRRQHKIKDADRVWQGLEELYRDDPSARAILEKSREEFGK